MRHRSARGAAVPAGPVFCLDSSPMADLVGPELAADLAAEGILTWGQFQRAYPPIESLQPPFAGVPGHLGVDPGDDGSDRRDFN